MKGEILTDMGLWLVVSGAATLLPVVSTSFHIWGNEKKDHFFNEKSGAVPKFSQAFVKACGRGELYMLATSLCIVALGNLVSIEASGKSNATTFWTMIGVLLAIGGCHGFSQGSATGVAPNEKKAFVGWSFLYLLTSYAYTLFVIYFENVWSHLD